jgi:ADP-ribose 1''-phosphate phosphatase
MLKIRKGSLFDAIGLEDFHETRSILLHACNCKGKWGSGIAAQFKRHFPFAFERYRMHCSLAGEEVLGKSIICSSRTFPAAEHREDPDTRIACLFTSRGYGRRTDPPGEILEATRTAIRDLLSRLDLENPPVNIHSPKINAGLFAVPWEDTEKVIRNAISPWSGKVFWTVWELQAAKASATGYF